MANRMTHIAHAAHHGEAAPAPAHSGAAISIMKISPRRDEGMVITSPAIDVQGWIDPLYSAAADGGSPALAWDRVSDAQAFALIVEDPDAPREAAFVHWMMWNIPGQAIGLKAGVARKMQLPSPQNAIQACNDAGTIGWYGPKPPPGHGVHHYHFQLFALDGLLQLDPQQTDVKTLVDAIKGRTLDSGELVGLFETPSDTANLA